MSPNYSSTFNFTTREEAAIVGHAGACKGMSQTASGLTIPDVEALIDTAMDQMVNKVLGSKDVLKLQNAINLTFSGGVATTPSDVETWTCSPDAGGSLQIGGVYATWVPTTQEVFERHVVRDQFWYTVQGSSASVRLYAANSAGPASGSAVLLACQRIEFPLLLTTHSELKGDFMLELIQLAQKKMIGIMPQQ